MIMRFVFVSRVCLGMLISLIVYPLALGGCIFVLSFIISFFIRVEFRVFTGIILILVFVGGLLVAFGYAISLASNPVFGLEENRYLAKNSLKLFIFLSLSFYALLYFLFRELSYFGRRLIEGGFQRFYIRRNEILSWGSIVVCLGLLLLITIVGVVFICSNYKGALVEFKKY